MTPLQRLAYIRDLDVSTSKKIVLTMLLSRTNKAGLCWPSVATIAKDTGLSVRTIRDVLIALDTGKLITRFMRHGKATNYTLTLEHHSAMVALHPGNGCTTEVVHRTTHPKPKPKLKPGMCTRCRKNPSFDTVGPCEECHTKQHRLDRAKAEVNGHDPNVIPWPGSRR